MTNINVGHHCDPRRTPIPRSRPASRAEISGPRPSTPRCLTFLRSTPEDRIAAQVVFDPDDIDAAFEELDARYLAGEAAAYAHTWSVIARGLRRVQPARTTPTTPDWVNIDHRRGIAFAPGDMTAYIRAGNDIRAGHPHLHRNRASAEQPRSRRHPGGDMGPRKRASTPSGGRSAF